MAFTPLNALNEFLAGRRRLDRFQRLAHRWTRLLERAPSAAVSATLRVVRESNVTPSFAPAGGTAWLSADGEIPSSDAALAKLRRRATARNSLSALRGVKAIVKVSYIATSGFRDAPRWPKAHPKPDHEEYRNENDPADVQQVALLARRGNWPFVGRGWRCKRECDSDDQ